MIVCDKPRFAVLHVPRTGGTALGEAIKRVLPTAKVLNSSPEVTHPGIEQARDMHGGDRRYFCIMRSPWEIMASHYSLFMYVRELHPTARPMWWADSVPALAELSWPEFCRRACELHIFRPEGGYSVKFVDDDVTVLQYADRPFAKLAKELGIRLGKVPHTNGGWGHPRWTKETVEMVAKHDYVDIERYKYEPPKVID